MLRVMKVTRLKLVRQMCGLRQIDLARAIGVGESTIAKWETRRSRPGPEILQRMAEVLCVPTEAIEEPDHD